MIFPSAAAPAPIRREEHVSEGVVTELGLTGPGRAPKTSLTIFSSDTGHAPTVSFHDPDQVLVEAVHPQPVQVDMHCLSTKLAAPLDETY